jgi:hypothetical protein
MHDLHGLCAVAREGGSAMLCYVILFPTPSRPHCCAGAGLEVPRTCDSGATPTATHLRAHLTCIGAGAASANSMLSFAALHLPGFSIALGQALLAWFLCYLSLHCTCQGSALHWAGAARAVSMSFVAAPVKPHRCTPSRQQTGQSVWCSLVGRACRCHWELLESLQQNSCPGRMAWAGQVLGPWP